MILYFRRGFSPPLQRSLYVCARVVLSVRPTGRGGGDGWVGGQNKVCVSKVGLSFLAFCSNFHFSPNEAFFGFGWVGGLVRVGGSARSPPISLSLVCAFYACSCVCGHTCALPCCRLGPDGTGYRVLLVLIFSLFVNPKLKQHEFADEFLAEEANNPVFKAYAEAASLNHEWQRAAMECTFELLCERALPSGSVSRPPSSSGTTSHSQSTPSPKHRFQQAAQSLVAKGAEDKE